MKRALSLLLCLMLILSLASTAFADDVTPEVEKTTTITISGGAEDSTYALYRILDASVNESTGAHGYTTIGAYDAFYNYHFGFSAESAVRKAFTDMNGHTGGADGFAKALYEAIVAFNATQTEDSKKVLPVTTLTIANGTATTASVPQGYYLIVETDFDPDNEYASGSTDTQSLFMMDTAGNHTLNITAKESAPTLEKLVYENNDSLNDSSVNKYDEYASRDIGDDVQFWIKVRPSGSYAGYSTYYVSVEDLMDPGLSYNGDLKVHVGNLNGPEIPISNFKVETITEGDKSGFKVSANLKNLSYQLDANNDGVKETHEIDFNTDLIFSYSAKLTEEAKVGAQGNWNEAKLIYQNDPYVEIWKDKQGDHPTDNTGETPKDENVVYTFNVTVNKVDAAGKPLVGATFTLYKYDAATFQYVPIKTIESGASGLTKFVFEGLDEGIYRLEETVAPDHHNAADDIDFHIHAVYDSCDPAHLVGLKAVSATSNDVILGEATYPHDGEPEAEAMDPMADHLFTVTLNDTEADLATTVYNYTGTELPSTGGMGTTMIYIAGGVLVLAAIVLLVTKKRMAGNE